MSKNFVEQYINMLEKAYTVRFTVVCSITVYFHLCTVSNKF
jgi:hypothetical protein